ncbi:PQQ-binding-like beta-propeller repeat protein [Planctomycetota bacterium]
MRIAFIILFASASLILWVAIGCDKAVAPVKNMPGAIPTSPPSWPRFRGPGGSGVAAKGDYPLQWDAASGKNIIWKTPIALKGESSPIVWGDRLFLTGGNADTHEVFCLDTASGKLIWQRSLKVNPAGDGIKVWKGYSHAPATAVTDGTRVCTIFANGDLACLDFAGKVLWQKFLGPLQNSYGYAASLDRYKDKLIVQLDQKKAKNGTPRSKLLALNMASGRTVWETVRPVVDSWSTPGIVKVSKSWQIITAANPYVIGHDAATGKELWRVDCLVGDVAPSPIYAGGLVFAAMESSALTAIRPDGKGNVTATHVAWQVTDGEFPSICSPVSDGKLLFLMPSSGYLICWDIITGKMVWEEDMEVAVVSSPALVGEHLYVIGEEGEGLVVKAGREFKVTARNNLGEGCKTSPAFVSGRIYLRGERHLFCLGRK